MANEVIIEEYSGLARLPSGDFAPIPDTLITSQVLNIATASAALSSEAALVRIQSKDTGFWYKVGGSGVAAAANTAGNRWLPANQYRDIILTDTDTNIDTAA